MLCAAQQPKSGLLRFIVEVSRSLTIIRGRSPLNGRSARLRGHHLNNTQQTRKTNIHALRGILTSWSQQSSDRRLTSLTRWLPGSAYCVFFSVEKQSLVGHGLLIGEVSQSHSDTPHLVELLWTSDQPFTETSTWQHTYLLTYLLHRAESFLRS